MKQMTINEFLEEVVDTFIESYEEAKAEQQSEQDETPTNVDFNDYPDGTDCEYDYDDEELEVVTTPIDDCITTFIQHCTIQGTIPSLEQAQSIYILDQINRSYQ